MYRDLSGKDKTIDLNYVWRINKISLYKLTFRWILKGDLNNVKFAHIGIHIYICIAIDFPFNCPPYIDHELKNVYLYGPTIHIIL